MSQTTYQQQTSTFGRFRGALLHIAAAIASVGFNRVKAKELEQFKLMGQLFPGSVSYRRACPRGAGAGPKEHYMFQREHVGARSFNRQRRRFVSMLKYHPWGRAVNA